MAKEKKGQHKILISKSVIDGQYTFVGTICHELTHIHDYVDFAEYYCAGDYTMLDDCEEMRVFYYWTEFHARKLGYSFLRKIYFFIKWLQ